MNQILYTGGPKKNNNGINIKKIISFFVIIIIMFGAAFLGVGVYKFIKKKNIENPPATEDPLKDAVKPDIQLSRTENDEVEVKISHDKPIAKIEYKWNETTSQLYEDYEENSNNIEFKLAIPIGKNTLEIIATDEIGVKQNKKDEFDVEPAEPQINAVIVQGLNKIKITITDDKDLSYVTYRWNEDEEEKIDIEDERKEFDIEIDTPEGSNYLSIKAVDKDNNTGVFYQQIQAGTKPKIKVRARYKLLHVTLTDDYGLKEVTYEINGQTYKEELYEDLKYEFDIPMVEGNNILRVTAINIYDVESEKFEGQRDYEPEEE